MSLVPIVLLLLLFFVSAFIGKTIVRKTIQVREATHELKQGSAGFLRGLAGWGVIVLWAVTILCFATVLGDWQISGDFDGAIERGRERLPLLFIIVTALGIV